MDELMDEHMDKHMSEHAVSRDQVQDLSTEFADHDDMNSRTLGQTEQQVD